MRRCSAAATLLLAVLAVRATADADPCKRQPFRGRCPAKEAGGAPSRSQFVLRYYLRDGECVSYPYGHCSNDDDEPKLYRYKEECEDACIAPANLKVDSAEVVESTTAGDDQTYGTVSSVEDDEPSTTAPAPTPASARGVQTHTEPRTPCEKQKAAASAGLVTGGFSPACTPEGDFERLQCEPDGKQCFCVDEKGIELAHSRTRDGAKPDCDGILSQKVVLGGDPQCTGGAAAGPCTDEIKRWYYDEHTLECTPFTYGGCGGNGNNYETEKECAKRCAPPDLGLPACKFGEPLKETHGAPVNCAKNDCPAGYTCSTVQQSRVCCRDTPEPSVPAATGRCALPKERGPCEKYELRFYYNAETNTCKFFFYGGCQGNENNFAKAEECEATCKPKPVSVVGKSLLERQLFPAVKTTAVVSESTPSSVQTEPVTTASSTTTAAATTTAKVQQATTTGEDDTSDESEEDNSKNFSESPASTGSPRPVQPQPAQRPRPEPGPELLGGNRCVHPVDAGDCGGNFRRWFWNAEARRCDNFVYTGCRGNGNNFATREECIANCHHEVRPSPRPLEVNNVCRHDVDAGECNGVFQRFAFDVEAGECRPFTYGGCGGNGNNFASIQECKRKCQPGAVDLASMNVCEHDVDSGECSGVFVRFSFDRALRDCRQFNYGGCGGNGNNFATIDECRAACFRSPVPCAVNPPCDQTRCQLVLDANNCGFCSCPPNISPTQPPTVQCPVIDEAACVEPCIVYANRRGCPECVCPVVTTNDNNVVPPTPVLPSQVPVPQPAPQLPAPSRPVLPPSPPSPPAPPAPKQASVKTQEVQQPRPISGLEQQPQPAPPQPQPVPSQPHPSVPTPSQSTMSQQTMLLTEKCTQPLDSGPCQNFVERWYFNVARGACEPFRYGGCAGNRNHFFTHRECDIHCARFSRGRPPFAPQQPLPEQPQVPPPHIPPALNPKQMDFIRQQLKKQFGEEPSSPQPTFTPLAPPVFVLPSSSSIRPPPPPPVTNSVASTTTTTAVSQLESSGEEVEEEEEDELLTTARARPVTQGSTTTSTVSTTSETATSTVPRSVPETSTSAVPVPVEPEATEPPPVPVVPVQVETRPPPPPSTPEPTQPPPPPPVQTQPPLLPPQPETQPPRPPPPPPPPPAPVPVQTQPPPQPSPPQTPPPPSPAPFIPAQTQPPPTPQVFVPQTAQPFPQPAPFVPQTQPPQFVPRPFVPLVPAPAPHPITAGPTQPLQPLPVVPQQTWQPPPAFVPTGNGQPQPTFVPPGFTPFGGRPIVQAGVIQRQINDQQRINEGYRPPNPPLRPPGDNYDGGVALAAGNVQRQPIDLEGATITEARTVKPNVLPGERLTRPPPPVTDAEGFEKITEPESSEEEQEQDGEEPEEIPEFVTSPVPTTTTAAATTTVAATIAASTEPVTQATAAQPVEPVEVVQPSSTQAPVVTESTTRIVTVGETSPTVAPSTTSALKEVKISLKGGGRTHVTVEATASPTDAPESTEAPSTTIKAAKSTTPAPSVDYIETGDGQNTSNEEEDEDTEALPEPSTEAPKGTPAGTEITEEEPSGSTVSVPVEADAAVPPSTEIEKSPSTTKKPVSSTFRVSITADSTENLEDLARAEGSGLGPDVEEIPPTLPDEHLTEFRDEKVESVDAVDETPVLENLSGDRSGEAEEENADAGNESSSGDEGEYGDDISEITMQPPKNKSSSEPRPTSPVPVLASQSSTTARPRPVPVASTTPAESAEKEEISPLVIAPANGFGRNPIPETPIGIGADTSLEDIGAPTEQPVGPRVVPPTQPHFELPRPPATEPQPPAVLPQTPPPPPQTNPPVRPSRLTPPPPQPTPARPTIAPQQPRPVPPSQPIAPSVSIQPQAPGPRPSVVSHDFKEKLSRLPSPRSTSMPEPSANCRLMMDLAGTMFRDGKEAF